MEYTADSFKDMIARSCVRKTLSAKSSKLPGTYLQYARADLSQGQSERCRVNAFSNAKRALHCQVDILIKGIGANKLKDNKYSKFPGKIELLQKCSIVSPAILRRINALRNKLEHEYLVPSVEETETCLDVVELFLAATDKLINSFPEHAQFADDYEDGLNSKRVAWIDCVSASGLLHARWKCLEVDEKALSKEIRKEVSKLKDKESLTTIQEKRIRFKGLKTTAWDSVFSRLAVEGSVIVPVDSIDNYCSWVRLLLKAA